jgi:hypothetical protein
MDLATLLIGIGALAVMIVPIFLIQFSNKRKKTKKLNSLKDKAKSLGVVINRQESWNEQLIGIDTMNCKLVVFNNIEDISSSNIFDLKDFKNCSLNIERRGGKSKKEQSSVIERINLILQPTNLSTPECKINFYDSTINMSIHNEMEVAEKWEKIICEVIAK